MQRPARPGYGNHERGDTHDGSRLGGVQRRMQRWVRRVMGTVRVGTLPRRWDGGKGQVYKVSRGIIHYQGG